jgi:hypothetical protein
MTTEEVLKGSGELEVAGEQIPVTFEFVITSSVEKTKHTVGVRKRSVGKVVANDGRTLPPGEYPLHSVTDSGEEYLTVKHVSADKWEIVFDDIE